MARKARQIRQEGKHVGPVPVPVTAAPVGLLVVTDYAKGVHAAVREVFEAAAVLQRCQWHKRENVLEYLPRAPSRDGSAEAAGGLCHPAREEVDVEQHQPPTNKETQTWP